MIKKICDRCKREKTPKDFFIKVLYYDLCPKCEQEFIQNLNEFVNNQIKTEEKPNEQEKISNT